MMLADVTGRETQSQSQTADITNNSAHGTVAAGSWEEARDKNSSVTMGEGLSLSENVVTVRERRTSRGAARLTLRVASA